MHPICTKLHYFHYGWLCVLWCRVPAGVSPSPTSLSAPAAGLICLSTVAAPCYSPQLLNPNIAWSLAEAVALADAVASKMVSSGGTVHAGAGLGAAAMQNTLRTWEEQHLGEVR